MRIGLKGKVRDAAFATDQIDQLVAVDEVSRPGLRVSKRSLVF